MKSIAVKSSLLVLLACLTFSSVQAQGSKQGSLNSGKLEQQFDYLVKKSNRYQEFKVVKKDWLFTFWSHVSDSLQQAHTGLKEAQVALEEKETTIESLQAQITTLTSELEEVSNTKDSIAFLGLNWNKASYKATMWGIIFGLIALCGFVFFRFMRSNAITKQSRDGLTKVQEEFEAYRKKALAKEQKLKRELQDELNKRFLNKAS